MLIFLQDNGFIADEKRPPGTYFYKTFGYMMARHNLGLVGVTTLRVAATLSFRGGRLAAMLDWVHADTAYHGGDPNRIVLMAHPDCRAIAAALYLPRVHLNRQLGANADAAIEGSSDPGPTESILL